MNIIVLTGESGVGKTAFAEKFSKFSSYKIWLDNPSVDELTETIERFDIEFICVDNVSYNRLVEYEDVLRATDSDKIIMILTNSGIPEWMNQSQIATFCLSNRIDFHQDRVDNLITAKEASAIAYNNPQITSAVERIKRMAAKGYFQATFSTIHKGTIQALKSLGYRVEVFTERNQYKVLW